MSNENVILADSIASIPHLAAFDLLVKQRFSELEMDKLLIYLIDTVDEDALPYLASQFDVLGFKGYELAHSVAEKREVVKRAIEAHRYKGTIWAIKQALANIGYPSATITEHVSGHWARFKVTINIGSNPINVAVIADLVRMIKEYKNVRSWLDSIEFTLTLEDDSVKLTDESVENPAVIEQDELNMGGNLKYDGTITHNGTHNYSQDNDVITITIV